MDLLLGIIFMVLFVGGISLCVAEVLTKGYVFDWIAFHLTGNYWYHRDGWK